MSNKNRDQEVTLTFKAPQRLKERLTKRAWLVAKSGREQYVRLNSDLARRLRAYIRTLESTEPDAPLFPSTRSWDGKRAPRTAVPTIKTFDKDLEAAGLPKKDARGRVLDFPRASDDVHHAPTARGRAPGHGQAAC